MAARFATVVRECVVGRSGQLLELRGDEALCVFGSPRAAVRCAVELQRRCVEELRSDPSLPLRVGVGIDAGEAVSVEGGYRGGALNLAARLCSIAKAGQVLVSEGVVLLARRVEECSYVSMGRVEFKGLREPVRYFAAEFGLVLPEAASEPRADRQARPFLRAGPAALGDRPISSTARCGRSVVRPRPGYR